MALPECWPLIQLTLLKYNDNAFEMNGLALANLVRLNLSNRGLEQPVTSDLHSVIFSHLALWNPERANGL